MGAAGSVSSGGSLSSGGRGKTPSVARHVRESGVHSRVALTASELAVFARNFDSTPKCVQQAALEWSSGFCRLPLTKLEQEHDARRRQGHFASPRQGPPSPTSVTTLQPQ